MKKICVFGGTTEGRMLTELFARKTDFHLCVATEYGEEVLGSAMEYGKIHVGRMSKKDMEKFLLAERFDLAVDATHPYAAEVSRNINSACENTSTVLLRCSRNACGTGGFENVRAAADYLAGKEGNIFVATGSKELSEYTRIPGYKERLFVRVLFCRQALEACEAIGLSGKNVIAMQGPFSVEQNVAAIRAAGAKYFVTKDSGAEGGMPAKEKAARICGAELIRIGRPCEEGDVKDFGTTVREISSRLGIEPYREVYLIGTGVGQNGMSGYAREIISSCGLLIGAPRMLADVQAKVPCVAGYRPEEIKSDLRPCGSVCYRSAFIWRCRVLQCRTANRKCAGRNECETGRGDLFSLGICGTAGDTLAGCKISQSARKERVSCKSNFRKPQNFFSFGRRMERTKIFGTSERIRLWRTKCRSCRKFRVR